MFSCEFRETLKKTFFVKRLRTAAFIGICPEEPIGQSVKKFKKEDFCLSKVPTNNLYSVIY